MTPHERETTDQRPGSMPDIRTNAGSITFIMTTGRVSNQARLVIRCDGDGELWVSIAPAPHAE